jgi:uncharacterized protein YyaL (SSP411 family)
MKTLLLCCLIVTGFNSAANDTHSKIQWSKFNKESFEQAKFQGKFVILDLVAVWCHWCHVMDKTTYTDDNVVNLLNKHFITTQADHDLRPDLAERYRDWGWPATIVLTSDGTEIVKRAGYIDPINMARLLQAIIDDPSPETTTLNLPDQLSTSPYLSQELVKSLKSMHLKAYDPELGGLKLNMKFIDVDSIEWDLKLASEGNIEASKRIINTLDNAVNLIDSEFGGAYQYSTFGDWHHPHYEKIMHTQFKFLKAYSSACQQLNLKRYCQSAKKVANYLLEFLYSNQTGAFYTSQDADLNQGEKADGYFKLNRQQRLAQGLPRIDKHSYSSHNGKAIAGLVHLYLATGENKYLDPAVKASDWIMNNRSLNNGGFKHDKQDSAGPYLADTLYMGRAFLLLYQATKEDRYLNKAIQAAGFIQNKFQYKLGGLVSAVDNGTPAQPLPQLEQNIDATRFFLEIYTHKKTDSLKNAIDHNMKFLATKEISTSRFTEAGVLLAHFKYTDIFKVE